MTMLVTDFYLLEITTYLANCSAVIARKASCDFVGGGSNLIKSLTIGLLSFSSHASYREDLTVLVNTLLELAKQNSQSCEIIGLELGLEMKLLVAAHACEHRTYLRHSRSTRKNQRTPA